MKKLTKKQYEGLYDETSAALNNWIRASLRLGTCVYSKRILNKTLLSKRPWCKLHSDAIEVMRLQRELAGLD